VKSNCFCCVPVYLSQKRSTFIPPHNPRDVLSYVRAKLDGTDLPPIHPWARGFTGSMESKDDGNGYSSIGNAKKISRTSLLINELPVGRWTNDYKTHLLKMQDKAEIESFVEDHTTTSVAFTVNLKAVQLNRYIKSGLHKTFKLETNLPITNMNAFDYNNVIQKYGSAESIADAHYPIRLALYHRRKAAMEKNMEYTSSLLRNKARFIVAVSSGDVDIARGQTSKEETIARLDEMNFSRMSHLESLKTKAESDHTDITHDLEVVERDPKKDFDYLLNMPMSSLNTEKIESLQNDAKKTENELDTIRRTSAESLWHNDLDKLESHL